MTPLTLLVRILILALPLTAVAEDPADAATRAQLRSAKWAYEFKDFKRAYELLLPQAEQGGVEAQTLLGKMYRDGHGFPKSFQNAFVWLESAWKQGHKPAAYEIAVMYDQGLLTPRDVKEAIRWYELAGQRKNGGGRLRDLSFHRDSKPLILLPDAGREAFAPPTEEARAEQERFTAELYKKLTASLALPEEATKDCYYTHDVSLDDSNVIKDVKPIVLSVGDHCRVPYQELNAYYREVTAAIWKLSPLPERPSWVTSARPIRIKYPRTRYEPTANRKAVPPESLLGSYSGKIAINSELSDVAMSLSCGQYSGCELTNTTTRSGVPSTTTTIIRDIYPVKDLGQINLSFQYAKAHQNDTISHPEYAAIMAALRPHLGADQEINECFDLTVGGQGASVACTLKTLPSKMPSLLFFGASLAPCREAFCGYVIYPMQKLN